MHLKHVRLPITPQPLNTCPRQDSNLHVLYEQEILSLSCLPISSQGLASCYSVFKDQLHHVRISDNILVFVQRVQSHRSRRPHMESSAFFCLRRRNIRYHHRRTTQACLPYTCIHASSNNVLYAHPLVDHPLIDPAESVYVSYCGRQGSNLHSRRNWILSPGRLPIPPRPLRPRSLMSD